MPEFGEGHGEMDADETDTTRASARLPGLDIEVTHRRVADGDGEQISVCLRAVPSFEGFGRAFEAANPFTFWAQSAQAAWLLGWLPWLEAARMMGLPSMLPWALAPALSRPPGGDGAFRVEPHSDG
jgi:hypothetical protein